jgi:GMP synthase (glutamine-hydrolysing)
MMDQPLRKSALAIRHVAFEDLGSFGPVLESRGYAVRSLDAGYDDLSDANCDLLVVLGGPIGANDEADFPFIRDELRLIEQRVRLGRPVLGICLGAQLIARALGARVYRAKAKEIGFAPVSLTAAGRQSCLAPLADTAVVHWHGDTFDLPDGARHLAATDVCPHQALAWGADDAVLALQFHPEVTARGLERWFIGHSGELAASGLSVNALRDDAARHGAALERAAGDILARWLAGAAVR